MARATFVQDRFTGGEWSKSAQGRITSPDYRTALNVCLNAIPLEIGAWLRRGGTRHCCVTRGGLAARVIGFDFRARFPYQLLLSDGYLRFVSEADPVTSNDDQIIVSISGANPAVIQTLAAHGWASGNQVLADSNVNLLQRRDLAITVLTASTFSIADAVSGTAIDGATLEAFISGRVRRVAEITTPYTGDLWRTVRSIQAETSALLVNGFVAPYVLSVSAAPTDTSFAEFDLAAGTFIDGPYLDPIPGSWATASTLDGVVTITLSFQLYSSAIAYSTGDYVTYSGQGYRSKPSPDGNINQNYQPDAAPDRWLPVNAGDPINGAAGFTSADIGRLIRLFSEPQLWASATSYVSGDIVTYAASGEAVGYYQATGSISGGGNNSPGRSTVWAVRTGASVARWTWGRITAISVTGIAVPSSYVGEMVGGGGLAAAFDGSPSKSFASSANAQHDTATRPAWAPFPWTVGSEVQYQGRFYRLDHPLLNTAAQSVPPAGYAVWTDIGAAVNITAQHYVGGHMAAPTQISSVTITPTTDVGFTNGGAVAFNLRAKSTAPTSPSDGTFLGTTGTIANTTGAVSIVSGDKTTTWNYVWVEAMANYNQPLPDNGSHFFTGKIGVAQVQFFSPNIANGSAITVQIVGDPLLYSNACRSWRLGLFGGTNGYPKNGTYDDNRIWLSGVLGNRIDSSKSGAFRNGALVLNMAPTAPDGTVADNNAITAVFTAEDVNEVLWMRPDQQGIICGTQAGEWLVGPSAPGALSPLNVKASRVTKIGCADILPCRTDHTLVFVQKFQQKIQEYFADIISGKFASQHLTKPSKHLTVSGVAELAYQQELAPVVWGRLGNGGWIGYTYQRDSNTAARPPDIAAAHRHEHGAGRTVQSISVGASDGGDLDSLYMVTEEPGGGTFHVEMMTRLLSEGFTLLSCWFVDGGIVPTSFTIDTTSTADAPYGGVRLYGLWPHEGKEVSAWLCGLDCGLRGFDRAGDRVIEDFTVANGSIFVPFGDGVSEGCGEGLFTQDLVTPFIGATPLPMVVGFTFTSDGQIVRPAQPQETGTRTGPALGRFRRIDKVFAQLYGCVSGNIWFGDSFERLRPAIFKATNGETNLTPLQLFDGIYRHDPDAESDLDNMICWRIERPHPAFVIAIGGSGRAEDE